MSFYIQGYKGNWDGLDWFTVDADDGCVFVTVIMSNQDLEEYKTLVSNYSQYL